MGLNIYSVFSESDIGNHRQHENLVLTRCPLEAMDASFCTDILALPPPPWVFDILCVVWYDTLKPHVIKNIREHVNFP